MGGTAQKFLSAPKRNCETNQWRKCQKFRVLKALQSMVFLSFAIGYKQRSKEVCMSLELLVVLLVLIVVNQLLGTGYGSWKSGFDMALFVRGVKKLDYCFLDG